MMGPGSAVSEDNKKLKDDFTIESVIIPGNRHGLKGYDIVCLCPDSSVFTLA